MESLGSGDELEMESWKTVSDIVIESWFAYELVMTASDLWMESRELV